MVKHRVDYSKLVVPEQEVFGTFEAADLFNIKRTTIRDDLKRGYIHGMKVAMPGTGGVTRTVFNRQQMYRVFQFYALRVLGVTKTNAAKRVAEQSFERPETVTSPPDKSVTIVLSPESIKWKVDRLIDMQEGISHEP